MYKSTSYRYLATLLAAALAAGAMALDAQGARVQAMRFLRLAVRGPVTDDLASFHPHKVTQVVANGSSASRWEIETGRRFVSVDDSSGQVTMYVDHELSGRCNGPDKLRSGRVGAAFFASEPQLGAIAERRLKAIGWEFGPLVARKRLPKANNNGEIGESIIFLKFYERPHGFSAEGAGNMVEIGLDSLTGEIVEMMRFIGYRSGPASLNVTRARAIEVARSATSLSASPIVIGPIYRQLSVQETLSKRGREFCRNKMLVLSYCIVGRQEVLVIAADTGEIVSRRSSARG